MRLERPKQKVKRVVLIARDQDGVMPTKCVTVYETTPQRVIDMVRAMGREEEQRGRAKASA